MTCFWDGIFKALKKQDFLIFNMCEKPNNIKQFIRFLQKNNLKVVNVTWNGEILTKQELEEHKKAVELFDLSKIHNGYLCSTCDSFLLLISQLFQMNIHHIFNGNKIKYINSLNNTTKNPKILYFSSNKSHFRYDKRT